MVRCAATFPAVLTSACLFGKLGRAAHEACGSAGVVAGELDVDANLSSLADTMLVRRNMTALAEALDAVTNSTSTFGYVGAAAAGAAGVVTFPPPTMSGAFLEASEPSAPHAMTPLVREPCGFPKGNATYGDIIAVDKPAEMVWFYAVAATDHNSAFALQVEQPWEGILARVQSVDGDGGCKTDFHHVETVEQSTARLNGYDDHSLKLVVYGGHGNGLIVKWGDGSCHNMDGLGDNVCVLGKNGPAKAHFEILRRKLVAKAAIHIDSCFGGSSVRLLKEGGDPPLGYLPGDLITVKPDSHWGGDKNQFHYFEVLNELPIAAWVAYQAPRGSVVLASRDCFVPRSVVINSTDWERSKIPGVFRFQAEESRIVFPGSYGCKNIPWEMEDKNMARIAYRMFHASFVTDYTCDAAFVVLGQHLCDEDDWPGVMQACCFCGGGEWK